MNPNHHPPGSNKGGQFAPKNSGVTPELKQSISPKSKTKRKLTVLSMSNISSKTDGEVDLDIDSLYHALNHGHSKMVNEKNLNRVRSTIEDPDFVYIGDKYWKCYYKKYESISKRYEYIKVIVNPYKKRVVTFFVAKITEKGEDKLYEKHQCIL